MDTDAPSGAALLDRLRGKGRERPAVDAGLGGQLLEMFEKLIGPSARSLPEGVVVRVTKTRVRQVQTCEANLVASLRGPDPATVELVQGQVLDIIFEQVVAGFPLGTNPVRDALNVAEVDGKTSMVYAWESLKPDIQAEATALIRAAATTLAARWPNLPDNAFPRHQDTVRIPLANGRVVLSGRHDLVLGVPAVDQVGTTLIDVKSGRRRYSDAADSLWYALLETMRTGSAPFQSGNYYLRTGELDLPIVQPASLLKAAAHIATAAARLVEIAAGAEPRRQPHGLCPWCPVLGSCEPGRHHIDTVLGVDMNAGFDGEEPDEDIDEDF